MGRTLSQMATMPTTSAAASTNQFFINNLIGKSALTPEEHLIELAGFKNEEEDERTAFKIKAVSKSP